MGRGSAVSPREPHGVVTVTRVHLRVWREESEASLGISHEETRSDVGIASVRSVQPVSICGRPTVLQSGMR